MPSSDDLASLPRRVRHHATRLLRAALFARPSARSQALIEAGVLPRSLLAFVLRSGGWHQLAVSLVSIAVFLLNAAPIETQRRIIDIAVHRGSVATILTLVAMQCAIVVTFGLSKLLMNVYRAWLGECATWALRAMVEARLEGRDAEPGHPGGGTGLSMIFAEADDVGAFVGSSISAPVVEAGFLISVFAYLALLDIRMTLVSLVVLAPQFVFVPLMQRAINRRVARRTWTLRRFGDDVLAAGSSRHVGSEAELLQEVFALDMSVFKLKFTLNFLMNFTYSLGNILVLAIGGLLVVAGQAEIATVVTFLSALGRVVDPWNDVVDWARSLAMAVVKYDLILRGAEGQPAGDPGSGTRNPALD